MRKFESTVADAYWIFDKMTRNKEGDYYAQGRYAWRAVLTIPDLEMYARDGTVREIFDDPDLIVAEGLQKD